MNETQVQECQEVFAIFDNKGDGCIPVKIIGDVLRAMGQNPTEADITKCIESLDREGRISFEVFLPILQTVIKNRKVYTHEDIAEGLRHFDNDGTGFISAAEFRHLLTALGEKLSEEETEQLFEGFVNDDGKVNYEQFIKQIMNE